MSASGEHGPKSFNFSNSLIVTSPRRTTRSCKRAALNFIEKICQDELSSSSDVNDTFSVISEDSDYCSSLKKPKKRLYIYGNHNPLLTRKAKYKKHVLEKNKRQTKLLKDELQCTEQDTNTLVPEYEFQKEKSVDIFNKANEDGLHRLPKNHKKARNKKLYENLLIGNSVNDVEEKTKCFLKHGVKNFKTIPQMTIHEISNDMETSHYLQTYLNCTSVGKIGMNEHNTAKKELQFDEPVSSEKRLSLPLRSVHSTDSKILFTQNSIEAVGDKCQMFSDIPQDLKEKLLVFIPNKIMPVQSDQVKPTSKIGVSFVASSGFISDNRFDLDEKSSSVDNKVSSPNSNNANGSQQIDEISSNQLLEHVIPFADNIGLEIYNEEDKINIKHSVVSSSFTNSISSHDCRIAPRKHTLLKAVEEISNSFFKADQGNENKKDFQFYSEGEIFKSQKCMSKMQLPHTIQMVESVLPLNESENISSLTGTFLFRQIISSNVSYHKCFLCHFGISFKVVAELKDHYQSVHETDVQCFWTKFSKHIVFICVPENFTKSSILNSGCKFCKTVLKKVSDALEHYPSRHRKEVHIVSSARINTLGSLIYCSICSHPSINFRSHHSHMENVHNMKTYLCSYCCFCASQPDQLNTHLLQHAAKINQDEGSNFESTNQTEFVKCPFCSITTYETENIDQHMLSSHSVQSVGQNIWSCIKCLEHFRTTDDFLTHLLCCSGRSPILDNLQHDTQDLKLNCPICPFTTDCKDSLEHHIIILHSMQTGPSMWSCVKCLLLCATPHEIVEHVYKCPRRQGPLDVSRSRTPDRKQVCMCPVCSTFIEGKNNLDNHILLTHPVQTGPNTWSCLRCCTPCGSQEEVQSHLSKCSVNKLPQENPLKLICNMSLKTLLIYKCIQCLSCYTSKKEILEHLSETTHSSNYEIAKGFTYTFSEISSNCCFLCDMKFLTSGVYMLHLLHIHMDWIENKSNILNESKNLLRIPRRKRGNNMTKRLSKNQWHSKTKVVRINKKTAKQSKQLGVILRAFTEDSVDVIDAEISSVLSIKNIPDGKELLELGSLKKCGHYCYLCDSLFENYIAFYLHMQGVHHLVKRFQCIVTSCKFVTSVPSDFQVHTKLHNQMVSEFCIVCDEVFADKDARIGHNFNPDHIKKYLYLCDISCSRKIQPMNYKCKICKASFGFRPLFLKHVETTCHEFNCTHCSFKFSKAEDQRHHLEQKHPSYASTCEFCGATYSSIAKLWNHLTEHDVVYDCELCHCHFFKQEELILHKEEHEPASQCPWDGCKKKFVLQSSLYYHMQIHESSNYKCDSCENVVNNKIKNDLRRKQKTQRTYTCRNYCGKLGSEKELKAPSCAFPPITTKLGLLKDVSVTLHSINCKMGNDAIICHSNDISGDKNTVHEENKNNLKTTNGDNCTDYTTTVCMKPCDGKEEIGHSSDGNISSVSDKEMPLVKKRKKNCSRRMYIKRNNKKPSLSSRKDIQSEFNPLRHELRRNTRALAKIGDIPSLSNEHSKSWQSDLQQSRKSKIESSICSKKNQDSEKLLCVLKGNGHFYKSKFQKKKTEKCYLMKKKAGSNSVTGRAKRIGKNVTKSARVKVEAKANHKNCSLSKEHVIRLGAILRQKIAGVTLQNGTEVIDQKNFASEIVDIHRTKISTTVPEAMNNENNVNFFECNKQNNSIKEEIPMKEIVLATTQCNEASPHLNEITINSDMISQKSIVISPVKTLNEVEHFDSFCLEM